MLKSLNGDSSVRQVHKLRTTTRRVEAIAAALASNDAKKSRRLLRSIEPVRKAAGGVRDMDVLIANARKLARHSAGDSLTRLLEHLQIARQQKAEELRRALGRRRDAAREDLKEYFRLVRSVLAPVIDPALAKARADQPHEGVHTAAMNVLRELGEWPPLDAENIHAFRLKVKELRYILQLSANSDVGLAEALGNVQRRIGDWHDWHQLEEIAREVLDAERDHAILVRIAQTVKRKFGQALAAANRLRGTYLSTPFVAGI